MSMRERLPGLTDAHLSALRSNAERLSRSGTAKQQQDATELLPAIMAEQAMRHQRRADAPAASAVPSRPKAARAKAAGTKASRGAGPKPKSGGSKAAKAGA